MYSGKPPVVNNANANPLGEFSQRDFTLNNVDDHVVKLLHDGEVIASFSQSGATQHTLQAECALHLVRKHNWDGVVYTSEDKTRKPGSH